MTPPGKITVATAHQECCMCPTIITGTTTEGATIYVRYRWGRLVIRLDHQNPPILGGAAGTWILDKQLDPEGIDGCLTYEALREHTAEIIDWPEEISPKTYGNTEATTWPGDHQSSQT
jgi:hypothetical protein